MIYPITSRILRVKMSKTRSQRNVLFSRIPPLKFVISHSFSLASRIPPNFRIVTLPRVSFFTQQFFSVLVALLHALNKTRLWSSLRRSSWRGQRKQIQRARSRRTVLRPGSPRACRFVRVHREHVCMLSMVNPLLFAD